MSRYNSAALVGGWTPQNIPTGATAEETVRNYCNANPGLEELLEQIQEKYRIEDPARFARALELLYKYDSCVITGNNGVAKVLKDSMGDDRVLKSYFRLLRKHIHAGGTHRGRYGTYLETLNRARNIQFLNDPATNWVGSDRWTAGTRENRFKGLYHAPPTLAQRARARALMRDRANLVPRGLTRRVGVEPIALRRRLRALRRYVPYIPPPRGWRDNMEPIPAPPAMYVPNMAGVDNVLDLAAEVAQVPAAAEVAPVPVVPAAAAGVPVVRANARITPDEALDMADEVLNESVVNNARNVNITIDANGRARDEHGRFVPRNSRAEDVFGRPVERRPKTTNRRVVTGVSPSSYTLRSNTRRAEQRDARQTDDQLARRYLSTVEPPPLPPPIG